MSPSISGSATQSAQIPTLKPRERAYAGGASFVFHFIVLTLLLSWNVPRSPGMPGPAAGAGINVTLVSAPSLGLAAPHAPPMNSQVTTPPPMPPATAPADTIAEAGESAAPFSKTDQPRQPLPLAAPQSVAWTADDTSNLSATLDGARRGAADAAGGDPSAADELLTQIARCLPNEMRPHLLARRLVMKIGPKGALEAAPMIDSTLPLLTADERAQADRVVQAALQCGPYVLTRAGEQVVSLEIDFSGIRRAAGILTLVR